MQMKLGILWYLVFLFSTVLHEAAHALAGLKLGDRTAYKGGQVSLNPLPHIKREPLGLVVVPFLSFYLGGWMFGWASTPYDVQWALRYPKRSALMSLAGPLANICLALLSAAVIHLCYRAGVFDAPETINFSSITTAPAGGMMNILAMTLSVFFSLNLILAIFNLLPLPGFDGSSLLWIFLDRETSAKVMNVMNARYSAIFLIVAWKLFDLIFDPIHLACINLLYPGVTYG